MTTRAEQKEQRRQSIMIKALELFVKKGYNETKISDIAEAADMSVGLLFHYFESKEQLYEELARMGLEGTKTPAKLGAATPLQYFGGFLDALFYSAKNKPWISQMFVLMSQARREGNPEGVREIALQVNAIEDSVPIIVQGQKEGYFREGDPAALSYTFWCSVQGVMEELAVNPDMPYPKTEWIMSILTGGKKA